MTAVRDRAADTVDLLREIDEYLARTGMAPSKFSLEAIGQTAFVFDLRRGMTTGARRAALARQFMRDFPDG